MLQLNVKGDDEMVDTDLELILDAACHTTAETAGEVIALLERAAAKVRHLSAEAEALQSRRRGDPDTGLVAEIRYIPKSEVSYFSQPGIQLEEVPGFRLADSRISQQE